MEFNKYKLKDLTVNGKGEYGIGAPAVKYSPNLYKYLRITDIDDNGFINTNQMKSINDKNEEKYLLKANDIVFARTGNSTGKSYFYNSDDGPLVYAGFLIKFSLDPTKLNPKYLRYYTLTNEYKGWINQFSIGSTRKNINAKIFGDMVISLPPRYYQDFVVDILDSLERKVKINKQMVANLEELSQTLFKHWFVDFEFPDEDGNPYKSSGGEMIDSELGEIPSDWKVGVLSDMTEIIMGQSPKSDTYNNNKVGLPLLNGASDFKNRNIKPTKYTSAPKKIGHNLDYVFGVRATIGLVTELDGEYAIGRGAGLSKNNEENREFIYEILNQAFTYFERIGSGSVYINISSKDLKQYKLIIPSKQVLMKYHYQLEPIFSELHNRKEQITSLTNLRDTLLPKLMSGELEIPDDIEVNIDEFSI
ncbi:restriction endonuclease subunit S [Staphylococcus epidermidis]|uniref:Type I restriction-modification system, specificity subunit S n=3 Tax=Staphylococcus epidermidis TaxID=1282 RepID=A0A6D1TMY8_STAEP|nr:MULTISPECIES: restriction endonuclease subunit S [Staphylococcus]MDU2912593.1 restriction endonuclease subunit S [Staphylococcus warneri]SLB75449.1 type I restriction-modification system specificity subunit [Mycobacteroides abscessus subsp. massiliense]HDA9330907.1 restriction endonuclease subunit S [Staphylococcus aureus]AVA11044.1 restriction endonuclease subunit S [Staphylococcus epidermidis]EGG72649.1 type I restriction modification DNA specificity domain protein [Staphylococcus epiderm